MDTTGITEERILSCGHPPSAHSENTTGTARLDDGREICWSCVDDLARELMRQGKPVTGYMSQDGKSITTWSGGKLANVTRVIIRKGRHRLSGMPWERHYWRAEGEGRKWHGSGQGPCMYTTMREIKSKPNRKRPTTSEG